MTNYIYTMYNIRIYNCIYIYNNILIIFVIMFKHFCICCLGSPPSTRTSGDLRWLSQATAPKGNGLGTQVVQDFAEKSTGAMEH